MKFKQFYTKQMMEWELLPLAILACIIIASIVLYPTIPANIPIHWNIEGTADGFGPSYSIFIIPLLGVVIFALLFVLAPIDVHAENIKKSYSAFVSFKTAIALFFAVIFIATLLAIHQYPVDIARIICVSIGALFMWLGAIIHLIKRNDTFGIRTPWTLHSDKSWNATHTHSKPVFQIAGAAIIVASLFLTAGWLFLVLLFAIIASILYVMIYSYHAYRKHR